MQEILDGSLCTENKNRPWSPIRCSHSKLENSGSFSRFGHGLLHENPNTSENNHELINYCNLTPEVPFVSSVAKSFPKKRMFFRKPKKSIKDLFNYKNITSPHTPCRECRPKSKQTKQSSRCHNHVWACQKTDDFLSYSDSSSDFCASVSEDAVSVQSFGSQAGCGEIFVDEEYVVSLEEATNPRMCQDGSQISKQSPDASECLGGNEQLASSGQTQVLDLMWETVPTGQSLIQGAITSPIETFQDMGSEIKTPLPNISASLIVDFAVINRKPHTPLSIESTSHVDLTFPGNTEDTNTPSNNKVTPLTWVIKKSENQESTIDEGYCDYISSDEHTGQSPTPVYSKKFPRDSYSGDALYELFFEPGEVDPTPIFDDEMTLTHSVFGLPSPDLPLSMYSFHVGSEENLAPTLPVDLIKNDFLQSNWAGKDCLLKLCDTEISLTMGLVNWLKQRTTKNNITEVTPPIVSSNDDGELCQEDKIQSDDFLNVLRSPCQNLSCWFDANLIPELHLKQQKGCVRTPESQPGTPTNHVCFQIFNTNSPSTLTQALTSPLGCSPSSGTGNMFVLAINKESLCQSCKALLKNGANKLHLCQSCITFVEQIKTSDFSGSANLHQPKIFESSRLMNVGVLPSPCSSYGIESDISLLSLVEQCANQMSSMKINQQPDLSTATQTEKEEQKKRKCTKKDVKFKKKDNLIGKGSLHHHLDHSSSVIKDKKIMKSGDLFLDCQSHSDHQKINPPINSEVSHSKRLTSLSLSNPNSSEFFQTEQKSNRKVKAKEHERMRRNTKVAVNMDGFSAAVVVEKKMERSRRIRK